MSNPSAKITVNSAPISMVGTSGANVAASSTVQIALANTSGVNNWQFFCSNYDGINLYAAPTMINAGLVVNPSTFTATFTAPPMAADGYRGAAMQFTSVVNAGSSTQNTVTVGIFVLNSNGSRMFFGGEAFESNATVGCAADLNAAQGISFGAAFGGDLYGSFPYPSVVRISGLGGNTAVLSELEPTDITYSLGDITHRFTTLYSQLGMLAGTNTTGSGSNMTIKAESAAAGNNNGGDLLLASGAHTGAGSDGQVRIFVNATDSLDVGNGAVYPNTDALLDIGTNSLRFGQIYAISGLSGSAPTGDSATSNMTIQASSAYQLASSNRTGANLLLKAGKNTNGTTYIGTGLINIVNGLAVHQITTSAVNYTCDSTTATSSDLVVFTDSTSNAINVVLPAPSAGRKIWIKDKVGKAATHNVLISQHAAETIDGSPYVTFVNNYDSVLLISDGTNWAIMGEFAGSNIV